MQVTVNGEKIQLPDNATVMDLLDSLSLGDAKVAIELNHSILPRSLHQQQLLQDQDQVEIVHAIGGG